MSRQTILIAILALAACSPSGGKKEQGAPDGAVRMPIPTQPAPAELPPMQPDGGQWSGHAGGGLDFGVPGQAPLLTITCTHAADGSARIRFVRRTRAEEGAQALFAVEGNLHVARVPMNVVKAGNPGEWLGEIDAHVETIGALKGMREITATLPGGGALKLAPSGEPGKLLDACRASDKGINQPAQQSTGTSPDGLVP